MAQLKEAVAPAVGKDVGWQEGKPTEERTRGTSEVAWGEVTAGPGAHRTGWKLPG